MITAIDTNILFDNLLPNKAFYEASALALQDSADQGQFRTLKYRPGFPDRFGSIEDARGFCQSFFTWYNHQHHHSGLGLMTPSLVHHGQAPQILAHRQVVLDAAFAAHPERFVRKPPKPPELPAQVWINKPPSEEKTP